MGQCACLCGCAAQKPESRDAHIETAEQRPELLPWWAIFDESNDFQPGLCASRSRAMRYRLSLKALKIHAGTATLVQLVAVVPQFGATL